MRLEYKTFEEVEKKFRWNERWEVFDKDLKNLNIAHECIDRHPPKNVAIRLKKSDGSTEVYDFEQLSRFTSQFANLLAKLGVNPGDRVAIMLNPCLEYYVSFFGALKRGAVAVPFYALLGSDGVGYRLKESNAKIIIVDQDKTEAVDPGLASQIITSEELRKRMQNEPEYYKPNTSADMLAVIQFSSGTTGQPKPVLYNHAAISLVAIYVKFWIGLREGDRYMCTSSPAWGHGIWYGTVGPMIYGNGIGAYSGKFIPEVFLEALEEFEISVVSAIPRVYKMLMDSGKIDHYKLKLRRLTYTGSAIEREVLQYFHDKFGIVIQTCYGNTEVGPIVLDFAFDDWEPRMGSAGKPMLGVKVGIIDEKGNELPPGAIGEVAVWRRDQWVLVGDSGYFDEEGYFWAKGRSDDVIKSSGFRIGPFEIEHVLEKHPAVQKAAVVGSPDKERGEIVKAFIVLKPLFTPSKVLESEIQNFVKGRLSMHEYPKEIEFVSEVPETPDGKLKRKVLKQIEYERKKDHLK